MSRDEQSISPTDQNQIALTVAVTASSMISASDMISGEAYQANLRRIQELKEVVRSLEVNNEVAHKNFVMSELEKRAQEGREAQEMLLRMQNTPRLPDNVQFTNHYPNVNQDVILPSTATLVEVPEASPSYPSPAQTSTFHPPPRTVQQRAPQQPQWTVQPQHPQTHPSSNSTFQSRAPPPVNRPPPQYSTVPPQRQIPVDNQRGQNVPRVNGYVHQNSPGPHGQPFYNPPTWSTATTHVQQPSQPWIRYDQARQGMSQQNAAAVYGPEYTTQPPELHNPQQAISGSLPSGSEYSAWPPQPAPRFPTRTNPPQAPSANAQNQSRNLPPRVASSQQAQVQPPPRQHRVGQPSGQPNLTEPHSRPHPHTGAPQPATVAHPRQQPQQPPQALSQPSTERPSTLKSAPVSHPSQTQPSQGRKTQPTNGPSQVPQTKSHPQSTSSQDQLSQQAVRAGHPLFASKAAFIEGFQRCVQLGPGPVKDFCNKACAAGITREWLEAAIETIPRPIWQSLLAQIRQTGNPDSQSQPVASEPSTSGISTPIAPVVSKLPLPSTNPPVETTNAGVQGERITVPLGITHSVQGQPMIPYAMAAHTKFYADEATRMALAAQGVKIPTTQPGTTPPVPTTPERDPSQTNVNPRTPLQADKKRLARDILRSLGRAIPKLGPNNAEQPMNQANVQQDEHEKAAVQSRSEAVPLETVPLKVPSVSSKPSTPAAISVPATSSSVLGAAPVSPTKLLVPKTELVPPKQGQPTSVTAEAPITIDLTLDDSDESVDQQGPKPTFPIRTPAAFVMSRPASPINTVTTTHTPQLESLSLAETHVEAEIGAPDVDVRMESPPLALELVYPAPGVSGSSHASSSRLPLFLPSPSASPVLSHHSLATEPPGSEHDVIIIEGNETKPSLKRRSIDGDGMEYSAVSVSPPRVKKRRKQQVYVLAPPPPPAVKKIMEKMKMRERAMAEETVSGSEFGEEDEELHYNHLEQVVIEESKSRLMERRCRWLNCKAILNCANNLLAHLKKHAFEESSQAPLRCHWAMCRRKFRTNEELDVHLEKHAILPLPCPFAGCNEEFDEPIEVMQHEVQHQEDGHPRSLVHKLTSKPFVPPMPARLGQPPHRLPSHHVLPRRILKSRISADRHAVVGPWVLWNIFSPVDLNTRKQDATMRGRPTRQGGTYDVRKDPHAMHDDYDFLVPLTTRSKISSLDDLHSGLVTQLASCGLTLWGPELPLNTTAESPPPAEQMQDESARHTAVPDFVTETGDAAISDVVASPSRTIATEEPLPDQLIATTGEEEAVERMLIQ